MQILTARNGGTKSTCSLNFGTPVLQQVSGKKFMNGWFMAGEQEKRTSYLASGAIICALLAIGLEVLRILLLIVHLEAGNNIVYIIYLSYSAGILGIIAICIITIRHRVLKGYIYALLAIILCSPFVVLHQGIKCQAKVREKRKKEWTGLYNLELLGKELVNYAKDNNDCLPAADKWCDALMEYNGNLTKENFKHPQPEIFKDFFDFKGQCQFAFNKNLSRVRLSEIPDDVVLLFEADGDWNLNGTSELLRTRYREQGYITILFANQTTGIYWFYKNAVRKFDPKGTYMYYEKPRWKP